jgi:hypothetical protein
VIDACAKDNVACAGNHAGLEGDIHAVLKTKFGTFPTGQRVPDESLREPKVCCPIG